LNNIATTLTRRIIGL